MTDKPSNTAVLLDQLRASLKQAHETFVQDNHSQKAGVEDALAAVITFLDSQFPSPEGNTLSLPLLRLLSGVRNPHTGLVQDIIKQAGKRAGGSSLATDEDGFRAFAAMAAELLAQSHVMPGPKANRYVARALTNGGWNKKRKSQGEIAEIDAATVEGWRQSYRSGSKEISGVVSSMAQTRINDLSPADAKTMADVILTDLLPTYYGHMRTPTGNQVPDTQ